MFVEGDWVKAEGTTLGADNGGRHHARRDGPATFPIPR